MKKIFSLFLITALMLAICACGAKTPPPSTPGGDELPCACDVFENGVHFISYETSLGDEISLSFSPDMFPHLGEDYAHVEVVALADRAVEFILAVYEDFDEAVKQLENFNNSEENKEYLRENFMSTSLVSITQLITLPYSYFSDDFGVDESEDFINIVVYIINNVTDTKGEISVGFIKTESGEYKLYNFMR
jgi:hypothetical protein